MLRARLPIPAGKDPGGHVRIGLAMEPPDHTGYFENLRVLMLGETNNLTAQFSSAEIARRSRLRIFPEFPIAEEAEDGASGRPAGKPQTETPVHTQDGSDGAVRVTYRVSVPSTAVHGDHAELILEADGAQMSHVRPQILRPAVVRFPDSIQVRLSQISSLPLYPPVIPVNSPAGRDIAVSIRNNAPEIRNFKLELHAEGVDFSPTSMNVSVGASESRDVSFRAFSRGASAGLHTGVAVLSGAAPAKEAFRLLVIPAGKDVAWTDDLFSFLENSAIRASFMPGRWLEYISKEKGEDRLSGGGVPFSTGTIRASGDTLVFSSGKTIRLAELDQLVPPKNSSRKEPASAH
jgi:hypothetical protein